MSAPQGLNQNKGYSWISKKKRTKAQERPCLIELTWAGFNHARTTTKASTLSVEARPDEYIKGICSLGSKHLNLSRTQLDRTPMLLHSHQKDISSLIFKCYKVANII